MLKAMATCVIVVLASAYLFLELYTPALSENHGSVQAELFHGEGNDQPLVVGFGGGEGGNAWASNRWRETRERFIEEGYAFLAIGYFGADPTPPMLDRIALDAVHDSILQAAGNPRVDPQRIALIGGSKGAELALNLASRYPDIGAVVAIVPSHVSFPATDLFAATSSWTFHGEEVPWVPMRWSAVPAVARRDLHTAFSVMLEDEEAVAAAEIAVERINGPILLMSATRDEMWPSTEMSETMMRRLEESDFPHQYEHLAIEGGHAEPLDHFDRVFAFLDEHLKR